MTKALAYLCLPLTALAVALSVYPSANHAVFYIINQALPSAALYNSYAAFYAAPDASPLSSFYLFLPQAYY